MYWEVYAYILDRIVKNIAVYDPKNGYTMANMIAQNLYGPNAFAVECASYPIEPGDKYIDGKFFHDELEVKSVDRVGDKIYEVEQGIGELGQLIGELLGG